MKSCFFYENWIRTAVYDWEVCSLTCSTIDVIDKQKYDISLVSRLCQMLVQRNSTSIEHRVGFAEQLRKFPHWSDASAYLYIPVLGKFFTHRVSAGWL